MTEDIIDIPMREELIVRDRKVRLSCMPSPVACNTIIMRDKNGNTYERLCDFSEYGHLTPERLSDYTCVLVVNDLDIEYGDVVTVVYTYRTRRHPVSFGRDVNVSLDADDVWVNVDLLKQMVGDAQEPEPDTSYEEFTDLLG